MSAADLFSVADSLGDADAPIGELLDQLQALTEHIDDLEQTVAAKDDRIDDLQQQVEALKADHDAAEKKRANDRERLSKLEKRVDETENQIANAKAHREALARIDERPRRPDRRTPSA